MAFSDFKYPDVLTDLGLTLTSVPNLFGSVPPLPPAAAVAVLLPNYTSLAASNTEMARMTWLVGPVLGDVWARYGGRVSLHVGAAFTADVAANLSGYCDFLIGRYPQIPNVRPPAVVLVEAKQDNIFEGLGQCIASMVGAQRFNLAAGTPLDEVFGVVTSGMLWRFLRLAGTDLQLDQAEYTIRDVDKIIGILVHMVGPIPPAPPAPAPATP